MNKIGVIGLGMMGNTHLDVYSSLPNAEVIAISDIDPERLSGRSRASGNIEGQAKGNFDLDATRKYDEGMKLIADDDIEVVDICVPTPLHLKFAKAAFAAGKHVFVEKPIARTQREAERMQRYAEEAQGQFSMPGMCMRFWPGWDWLKDAIDAQRYGHVVSANFRRIAPHPGTGFYNVGEECGGALLDLHVHDTDFVQWCFGMPKAVTSHGYSKITSEIDHLFTHYDFGPEGPLVTSEGSWAMAKGFPFTMQFTVNCDKASITYDTGDTKNPLKVYRDGQMEAIPVAEGMGYFYELRYFLDCIEKQQPPKTVTIADAARSIKIIESEGKSILKGRAVSL